MQTPDGIQETRVCNGKNRFAYNRSGLGKSPQHQHNELYSAVENFPSNHKAICSASGVGRMQGDVTQCTLCSCGLEVGGKAFIARPGSSHGSGGLQRWLETQEQNVGRRWSNKQKFWKKKKEKSLNDDKSRKRHHAIATQSKKYIYIYNNSAISRGHM